MVYEYSEQLTQVQHWLAKTQPTGWLPESAAALLDNRDSANPDNLFAVDNGSAVNPPLIVAFMGGTGVGKSSLLNRLAGQNIARAGVQRPTSREVTLYHHSSLSLQHLPKGLPLDSVRISSHDQLNSQHVVWMDMPDFDSIEQGNQHMVLEWLPHIDVLLYVVSPERYRDNKAWQLLLAEGEKHAWLFVMNQWDRAQPVQFQDFQQQLHKAGFNDPLVFRTSCIETADDEFNELLAKIQALSGENSRLLLAQHHQHLRSQHLQQALQRIADDCQVRDFPQLQKNYEVLWKKTAATLQQGLAWSLQQCSTTLPEQSAKEPVANLWDDWAQSCFDDMLDELQLQAAQQAIPIKTLKISLQDIKERTPKIITRITELAGRQALLNPGNAVQRFFLKLTGLCETVLPLLAMAVVGYYVFTGYYYSSTQSVHAYLGVDFAVHSVLLIGLCWLVPFFLHKKLQPSLQKAALKGLQKGFQQALLSLDTEVKQVLKDQQNQHTVMQQELAALLAVYKPVSKALSLKDSLLDRVLMR